MSRGVTRRESHPLAGKTVYLKLQSPDGPDIRTGDLYHVEDWWENVSGGSWMTATGNPAALKYAVRSGVSGMPIDNEVVYGKVNFMGASLGHLVHVDELGDVAE